MPKDNKQKIKLLYLMEVLRQETDEQHPMSTNQICKRLGEQGISCERRTVGMDMKVLNDYGYEIIGGADQQGAFVGGGAGVGLAALGIGRADLHRTGIIDICAAAGAGCTAGHPTAKASGRRSAGAAVSVRRITGRRTHPFAGRAIRRIPGHITGGSALCRSLFGRFRRLSGNRFRFGSRHSGAFARGASAGAETENHNQ